MNRVTHDDDGQLDEVVTDDPNTFMWVRDEPPDPLMAGDILRVCEDGTMERIWAVPRDEPIRVPPPPAFTRQPDLIAAMRQHESGLDLLRPSLNPQKGQ